jgi:hypothetical protein
VLFPDDVGVDAFGVDDDFRFLLVLVGRVVSEKSSFNILIIIMGSTYKVHFTISQCALQSGGLFRAAFLYITHNDSSL